jgi:hypothetical protein
VRAVHDKLFNQTRLNMVSGQKSGNTTQGSYVITGDSRRRAITPTVDTFKLKFVEDDYLVCRSYDNGVMGTEDVYVLKPAPLWCSVTDFKSWGFGLYPGEDPETPDHPIFVDYFCEYAADASEPFMEHGPEAEGEEGEEDPFDIWGEPLSAYAIGGPNYHKRLNVVRTVNAGGVEEQQRAIPLWRKGEIIHADEIDGGETTAGILTPAGQPIEFIMRSDGRVWARA